MRKIWVFFIILIIIFAILVLAWLLIPAPAGQEIGGENGENGGAPALFQKGDYKIVEENSEKYVKVDKIGLLAKIPKDWEIEFQGGNTLDNGYFVNLYSPDAEIEHGIQSKGCGISVTIQKAKDAQKELQENINLFKQNPSEAIDFLKEDYALADDFKAVKISDYDALELTMSERPFIGGGKSINIPLGINNLLSFDTTLLPGYKDQCLVIWQEFIQNIELK